MVRDNGCEKDPKGLRALSRQEVADLEIVEGGDDVLEASRTLLSLLNLSQAPEEATGDEEERGELIDAAQKFLQVLGKDT